MEINKFYKSLGRYSWNGLAWLFIIWGIFAALTPLTPLSWTFFIGLIMIFGRRKTESWVKSILGRDLFIKLRISAFFKKMADKIKSFKGRVS